MPVIPRPRRRSTICFAALTAVLAFTLSACGGAYPNSVFTSFTEFNRDVGYLFKILIWLGTIVFVFVEALLLYTLWRYRQREGQKAPEHVHGNTTLEILWTVIPAIILVFIAVPTVRTIFRTQAKARPDALTVEVVGHQWWWEFRYPQYTTTGANGRVDTLVTANELYLPLGRTVNFHLKSADVLHSFWIPQLGGKRDLVTNHTNYLWFTPDSTTADAWNGFCAEYCGASHANMKFRAFTVTPQEFEGWVSHQLAPAVALASQAAGTAPAAPAAGTTAADSAAVSPMVPATQGGVSFAGFPRERLKPHNIPATPAPAIAYDANLQGDAARGQMSFVTGGCIGCHSVRGNPTAIGIIGPNLSHFAARHTLAAGIYPNDTRHLALWIKNARRMKPGTLMPTLGKGEIDPQTGAVTTTPLLTDQQIADIVAYLQSLQ
jgi:cytochrome c oxidase subunit II